MRILVVNEDMELGGAQRMAVVLANSLAKNPEVRLVFAAAQGPLSGDLDSRVPFFEIPNFTRAKAIDIIRRLRGVIARFDPDIIHSHGATLGVLSSIARASTGSRALRVLTHHSKEARRIPGFLVNPLFRMSFDHLVAVSRHKRENLVSRGLPGEMVSLIPNFVAVHHGWDRAAIRSQLGISKGEAIVTMASRLIRAKRCDLFIELLAGAAGRTNRHITGLLIGDGPELATLKLLAEAHKERVSIRFLGYQREVARFLSITDVFLFPSAHPEVLPMALIEAASMGVPIICSNIPGNDEVVQDGYNGYLVLGDRDLYCKRLVSLLEDDSIARAMSENARRSAMEMYGEGHVTSALLSLYRRLMSRCDLPMN